ncbi:MAG: VWA domain-containing protein [gamma proteobacterium symbiont of Bathyaustriella thionipta]|nr:VWA domain-containing protein [gamma proteobacterium symbiont of Bathyaustriella thionipta]MCU7948873.1 VWA domain-containing protein [gamma proteobacterium symbiont of Bathyaustriella thionipta]MCU7952375.1 VWA domain-containing protein [gamma proteobacterium symbiont of Bathyaustriella thionipta]MCU7955330.1 VWA domain-containing protein [gamma proteobacterium symbiont of Bathyaustriella thionipta]
MYSFDWPWMFLLLPLPALVYWLSKPVDSKQKQSLKVPFYEQVHNLTAQHSVTQLHAFSPFAVFAFLAWIFLITASAQPKWSGETIEIPVSGRDLMLAVDISGSMETPDMFFAQDAVNRLTAVKSVLQPFIRQREGDRMGLILFADNAYLQTPLTFDRKTIEKMLYDSFIGMAGSKATAIGDAIGLAVKRLKDLPADESDSRVLILLTDGSNNAGIDPVTAAKLAKQIGIKIYSIGFGADEMIVRSFMGRQRVNPSRDLDEKTLKLIAETTGGQYFRARDTQELKKIYQTLDQLEPVESDNLTYRPSKALFYWPLSISLVLSLILIFAQWSSSNSNKTWNRVNRREQ